MQRDLTEIRQRTTTYYGNKEVTASEPHCPGYVQEEEDSGRLHLLRNTSCVDTQFRNFWSLEFNNLYYGRHHVVFLESMNGSYPIWNVEKWHRDVVYVSGWGSDLSIKVAPPKSIIFFMVYLNRASFTIWTSCSIEKHLKQEVETINSCL